VAAVTGAAALPTSTTAAAEASSPEAEAEGADSSRRMADIRAESETAVVKRLYCIFLKRKNCKKSLGPQAEINIYIKARQSLK
jgi:2-keto-4-pentenoate hydratase/2-oxohepta-3-ene-1,7-dioic acid hydratase in catechol pathway